MSRSDPIRLNYYEKLNFAEMVSNRLFTVGALLSFGTLLIDKSKYPAIYDIVLILFSLSAVGLFILGFFLRLYLTPRAEDKRRQDFYSNACNVTLIHQKTDGYYNNDFKDPIKRMAAQVLENSLFTKEIALRMTQFERIKVFAYILVWLILLYNRRTDLGWIVVATQVIFSEQILSRWLRLEWLRFRSDKTFEDVYKLFQTKPAVAQFNAHTLNAVSMYESSKATAAITLSSKIFDELNPSLSAEWDMIKEALNI